MTLEDELLADGGVERPVHVLQQQRPCVTVSEPLDREGWEPCEDVLADAGSGRADKCYPLGEEPAGDEAQNLRGRAIEPLRVVDKTDECLFIGGLGQKCECGEPDQKTVWCGAGGQSEEGPERIALWGRQAIDAIQQRRTELVQPAVGKLHLGFDGIHGQDAPVGGTLGREV